MLTSLADRYRPRTLAEVVGQPWAVDQLQRFVEQPHSTAFLFEGGTGTGKTSAAMALAADLGIDVPNDELGGLHQIASGEQTGESVRRVMNGLRVSPWTGSGWRMLVVNEADCMTPNAAYIWLDALENLPARCVVVFTTNHPEKLPARLRDRCERFRFEGGYLALTPYLPELIARVWKGETGRDDAPDLDALGTIQDEDGNVSVRRVLQLLTPWVRNGIRPEEKPAVVDTETRIPAGRFDAADAAAKRNKGVPWTVIAKAAGVPVTTARSAVKRLQGANR
jgi:hypothetical protein